MRYCHIKNNDEKSITQVTKDTRHRKKKYSTGQRHLTKYEQLSITDTNTRKRLMQVRCITLDFNFRFFTAEEYSSSSLMRNRKSAA